MALIVSWEAGDERGVDGDGDEGSDCGGAFVRSKLEWMARTSELVLVLGRTWLEVRQGVGAEDRE